MVTEHPQTEQTAHAAYRPHRHERPGDWGWHAEMGRGARVAGIICALLLCLLPLSSHGSRWELVWALGFAGCIIVALVWDRNRRRNAWRP